MRRLLYIAFFFEVGLLLVVLPWSAFWDRNYFAALSPAVRVFIMNNFVRGGVSGLGLLNLVAGFMELSTLFSARDRDAVDGGRSADMSSFRGNPDAQVDR